MRAWVIWGLCCAGACHPIQDASIAVAPRPTESFDSATVTALAVAATVARRHGLEPFVPKNKEEQAWLDCYERFPLYLCGKMNDQEIQFSMWERPKLSANAESLRVELLDSLRMRFGTLAVRECRWEGEPDPRKTGCKPLPKPVPHPDADRDSEPGASDRQ